MVEPGDEFLNSVGIGLDELCARVAENSDWREWKVLCAEVQAALGAEKGEYFSCSF